MATTSQPEAWLRGPVPGIPSQLQPVAHSLVQAREDVPRLTAGLKPADLWRRPGDAAPVGFHIRHMARALDRLLTYARGEPLSADQLRELAEEKTPSPEVPLADLLAELDR